MSATIRQLHLGDVSIVLYAHLLRHTAALTVSIGAWRLLTKGMRKVVLLCLDFTALIATAPLAQAKLLLEVCSALNQLLVDVIISTVQLCSAIILLHQSHLQLLTMTL